MSVDPFTGDEQTPGEIHLIMGPMFGGKCEGKGTKILMHDGSVKCIEDVKEGDALMGDDGTKRNVISVTSGFGKMYDITPSFGNKMCVNGDHILCLAYHPADVPEPVIVEMSVDDFLGKGKDMINYYLFSRFIPFREDELENEDAWDCGNAFAATLSSGIQDIPDRWRLGSFENRSDFLWGLLAYFKDETSFNVTCRPDCSKEMLQNIGFLARSVALKVEIKGEEISIGMVNDSEYDDRKVICPIRFQIEKHGDDDFYGFTLDGNGRYVHSDFIITHNTTELLKKFNTRRIAQKKNHRLPPILLIRKDEGENFRYSSEGISTHDMRIERDGIDVFPANLLEEADHLAAHASHIYIDEGQFFPDLRNFCEKWALKGKDISVACLDAYGNHPSHDMWPSISEIIPIAADIEKYCAVCFICGGKAPLTLTLNRSDEPSVQVGGKDKYEARCIKCVKL